MAMHESDGIAETFDDALRIAVTVGVRAAEHRVRAREQETRAAQAESEQAARQVQQRIETERAAAVAALEQVRRDDWWETASVEEIQHVCETAETWREVEPRAAEVSREIREQLQRRGIVPGEGDPAAAIDNSRRSELADAQVLAAASDRAEAREREDRDTQPQAQPEAGVDVDGRLMDPYRQFRNLSSAIDGVREAQLSGDPTSGYAQGINESFRNLAAYSHARLADTLTAEQLSEAAGMAASEGRPDVAAHLQGVATSPEQDAIAQRNQDQLLAADAASAAEAFGEPPASENDARAGVDAPADAVQARDLADVSQALPPEDAVARGAARAREKPARRGSHQRGIRREERGL